MNTRLPVLKFKLVCVHSIIKKNAFLCISKRPIIIKNMKMNTVTETCK